MTGILRRVIEEAAQAMWVAEQIERLITDERTFFWRGLHYALVARGKIRKPNRRIYVNSEADWEWLQTAGELALRHGYVPGYLPESRCDREVKFQSNDLRFPARPLTTGLNGSIAEPHYARAIFSDKPWLHETLEPIARRCRADLILSAGKPNYTFVHEMAADAVESGRPLVVFPCVDCGPAGVQVTVLIARMLQALRDGEFPNLQFAVHEVAVTPEQAKALGLPPIPLNSSERPCDQWKALHGVEPTEIDALAALNPDALEEILAEASNPYSDASLDRLVRSARHHSNSAKPLFLPGH